jgi:RecA/RadA recombinase
VTDADVKELVQAVARGVCPVPSRFLDEEEEDKGDEQEAAEEGEAGKCSSSREARAVRFGDDEIDGLLGGGIQTGVITELAGER